MSREAEVSTGASRQLTIRCPDRDALYTVTIDGPSKERSAGRYVTGLDVCRQLRVVGEQARSTFQVLTLTPRDNRTATVAALCIADPVRPSALCSSQVASSIAMAASYAGAVLANGSPSPSRLSYRCSRGAARSNAVSDGVGGAGVSELEERATELGCGGQRGSRTRREERGQGEGKRRMEAMRRVQVM